MDLVDDLGREGQAAPALRRLAEMAINVPHCAQAGFGSLADVALAVAIADTDVHEPYDTQLRIVVNRNWP